MVRLLSRTTLRPQSFARVQWETAVTEQLATLWESTYSDASGFMDLHTDLIDEQYAAGCTPAGCASLLANIDQGA